MAVTAAAISLDAASRRACVPLGIVNHGAMPYDGDGGRDR